MNTSYKCNCCCKEDVCNKKGEYTLDCNMIKQAIKSSATEVSIKCKYFQAYSTTIKRGEEHEDS